MQKISNTEQSIPQTSRKMAIRPFNSRGICEKQLVCSERRQKSPIMQENWTENEKSGMANIFLCLDIALKKST